MKKKTYQEKTIKKRGKHLSPSCSLRLFSLSLSPPRSKKKAPTDAMISFIKSHRRPIFLCVVLSLALLGASVVSADSASSTSPASSSPKCACSDVRPRSGGTAFELGPTCADIQAKGNCNEGYMQKTIAEMKGAPYCQVWRASERRAESRGERERERNRKRI